MKQYSKENWKMEKFHTTKDLTQNWRKFQTNPYNTLLAQDDALPMQDELLLRQQNLERPYPLREYYATCCRFDIENPRQLSHSILTSLLKKICNIQIISTNLSKLITEGTQEDIVSLGNLIRNSFFFFKDIKSSNLGIDIKNLYTFMRIRYSNLQDDDIKDFLHKYTNYINKMPISGVVLLNTHHTKILLVKNYASNTWSYPKGKIEFNETPHESAIRECYEETGINIHPYINKTQYIRSQINGKTLNLYFIEVPEDIYFSPKNKFEIVDCNWHEFSLQNLLCKQNYNVYINKTINKVFEFLSHITLIRPISPTFQTPLKIQTPIPCT